MDPLDIILEKLVDQKNRMINDLVIGNKDFEEYKHSCGVVRGLLIAISTVQDLKELMEGNDD
jgi:hypothetical protein